MTDIAATSGSQRMWRLCGTLLFAMACAMMTACSEVEEDDGEVSNALPLPLATRLDLYCDDVGIGTENCVLEDPANPFRNTPISFENRFDLYSDSPSSLTSFYLWATAQAIVAFGENQYYTALSLHELYADSIAANEDPVAQEIIRVQALKAYRSVLDNYLEQVTFFGPFIVNGEEVFFPEKVSKLTTENLYLPTTAGGHPDGLVELLPTTIEVLSLFGEWGYTYNEDTGEISPNF